MSLYEGAPIERLAARVGEVATEQRVQNRLLSVFLKLALLGAYEKGLVDSNTYENLYQEIPRV